MLETSSPVIQQSESLYNVSTLLSLVSNSGIQGPLAKIVTPLSSFIPGKQIPI